jgi:outer membrane protein TolC
MGRTNVGRGAALCLATAMAMASNSARAQQESAARLVTVADAVGLALRHNPDALSSDAQVQGAESSRAEARGGFGPKLHVDANAQQWDSVFRIQFGNQNFTARQAFTWSASVSLVQPITPLFAIYDQYKVQDFGVDVASIRRAVTRRDVALGVVEAYYRLLEAMRLSQVATASVAQLEAQQKQAQSLFANGVIGKNDLLRAGLALATARQRAIQMGGQVELGRGQLAAAMGVPDSESFEPVPFVGEPPPGDEPTLPSAEGRAVAQRLELRELDRRIDQADKTVSFAKTKLLPQVNAIGNYTHFDGSPFQQVNGAYVGLFASWDVWEWGTTLNGIAEAEARLRQARLARKKAEDEVRLEARRAFVNATTAREALGVARAAVSEGEENYRIVVKRFENAAATSFDVVDAEALLTQARGQVETALYDLLIAQAALEKATGAPLPGE